MKFKFSSILSTVFYSCLLFVFGSVLFSSAAHAQLVDPLSQGQSGTTLAASVSATASNIKTFHWTINKSVNPDTWNLFVGDTGTSQYTVGVTKDSGTEITSITGQVCVTNGGSVDTQNLAISVDLTMPPSKSVISSTPVDLSSSPIISAEGNHCYDYSIPVASPVAGATYKVTANITITNHSGSLGTPFGPSPSATTNMPNNPTLVNDTINVDDTNGQSWQFGDSGSQQYTKQFSCSVVGNTTYNNTATIRETGQSASASVTVNCYDPTVTKTAATAFTRSYNWNLVKTGDQTNLTLALNESFFVNYTVTASATFQDFNFAANGTITVANPAPIAATINSLSDLMTGGLVGNVNCPVSFPYILAANSSFQCTYTATLPDNTTRTNTATAVQQNYSYDQNDVATPTGTTNYTGQATVDFSKATITEVGKCITVSDDKLPASLGTLCYGVDTLPHVYTYQINVGGYATCGPRSFTNTASFVVNDTNVTGSSGWTVNVNVPCQTGCTLTIGYWKNHAGFGPQNNMIKASWLPTWLGNPLNLGQQAFCSLFPSTPGCKSFNVSSNQIAVNVLGMQTYGAPSNGITKLYAQLLAADFNIDNGASSGSIATTITNANNFLSNFNWQNWSGLSKTQQNTVLSWMSALDNYNNGLTGPGHCSQ